MSTPFFQNAYLTKDPEDGTYQAIIDGKACPEITRILGYPVLLHKNSGELDSLVAPSSKMPAVLWHDFRIPVMFAAYFPLTIPADPLQVRPVLITDSMAYIQNKNSFYSEKNRRLFWASAMFSLFFLGAYRNIHKTEETDLAIPAVNWCFPLLDLDNDDAEENRRILQAVDETLKQLRFWGWLNDYANAVGLAWHHYNEAVYQMEKEEMDNRILAMVDDDDEPKEPKDVKQPENRAYLDNLHNRMKICAKMDRFRYPPIDMEERKKALDFTGAYNFLNLYWLNWYGFHQEQFFAKKLNTNINAMCFSKHALNLFLERCKQEDALADAEK